MVRFRPWVALLISLAAVGGSPRVASHSDPGEACSCHDGGPVCQDFWTTPVVFLGRVTAITSLPQAKKFDGPHERVEFQVLEAFRGTSAPRIELFNYSTTCHHGFSEREEWMIYASPRHDGPGLMTDTCSRTRRRSEAGVDLSYARSAYSKSSEKGLIVSTVTYQRETATRSVDEPLAGVKVTAHQPWSTSSPSGVTNRDGRVELTAEPGLYRVIAEPPAGWRIPYDQSVVQLVDARGCAAAAFSAERSRNQLKAPTEAR
jgi:hypothetical protein